MTTKGYNVGYESGADGRGLIGKMGGIGMLFGSASLFADESGQKLQDASPQAITCESELERYVKLVDKNTIEIGLDYFCRMQDTLTYTKKDGRLWSLVRNETIDNIFGFDSGLENRGLWTINAEIHNENWHYAFNGSSHVIASKSGSPITVCLGEFLVGDTNDLLEFLNTYKDCIRTGDSQAE